MVHEGLSCTGTGSQPESSLHPWAQGRLPLCGRSGGSYFWKVFGVTCGDFDIKLPLTYKKKRGVRVETNTGWDPQGFKTERSPPAWGRARVPPGFKD